MEAYIEAIKSGIQFVQRADVKSLKERREKERTIHLLKALLFEFQAFRKCPNGHEHIREITGSQDTEPVFICLECEERWMVPNGNKTTGVEELAR